MNEFVRSAMLVLCASALGFVALELGIRLCSPDVRPLTLTNFIYDQVALLRSGYPSAFDAELGYIPRPGYSGIANAWGTQVTINADYSQIATAPPINDEHRMRAARVHDRAGDDRFVAALAPALSPRGPAARPGRAGQGRALRRRSCWGRRAQAALRAWSLAAVLEPVDLAGALIAERVRVRRLLARRVALALPIERLAPSWQNTPGQRWRLSASRLARSMSCSSAAATRRGGATRRVPADRS